MKYHFSPVSADFSYSFDFREPLVDLYRQNPRIDLIAKLLKSFNISIDVIKFDTGKASSKSIEFSKFYDQIWFNVSIGLEKVEAILRPFPKEEELLKQSCKVLFEIFDRSLVSLHEMTLHAHFSVREGSNEFLESINPYCPPELQKFVTGRGVSYEFRYPDHELDLRVTVAKSILIADGVYVAVYGNSPSIRYDFDQALRVFLENANKVGDSFQIEIEGV